MNAGPVKVAIISVATVVAIGLLANGSHSSAALAWVALFAMLGVGLVSYFRYLTARKQAHLQVSGGEQYRALAEEYRRLSDLAITAQEHTDLKMGEISAQLDHMRTQIDSLQKILRDVE
ncbi:MAG TPA: hypothetical protein VI365_12515 [Trebonia sp.]